MARMVNKTKIAQWTEERDRKKDRLMLYYQMEEKLLAGETQSYSLGSRSKSKFNMSLTELQNAIKKLEEEIKELDNLLNGVGARKVISIIPSF